MNKIIISHNSSAVNNNCNSPQCEKAAWYIQQDFCSSTLKPAVTGWRYDCIYVAVTPAFIIVHHPIIVVKDQPL